MGILDSLKARFAEKREKSANMDEFRHTLMVAVADGSLSPDEINELKVKYKEFGLTFDDVAKIRVQAYVTAFDAARADGKVTAEKERELERIQAFLRIPDQEIEWSKTQLARLRLLTEIDKGNLPTAQIANLVLQRGEVPHWIEPAGLLEDRVVRRRIEGRSAGVSFRIAKGVHFRVGQSRGHLVSDTEVLEVSSGELVITSKRVIFRGNAKSFSYCLDKLLDIGMFSDGLRLAGETGPTRMVKFRSERNTEVIGAVLSAAVNRYRG